MQYCFLCLTDSNTEGPTPPKLCAIDVENPAASTAVKNPDPQTPGKPASTAMEDFFGEVYIVTETPGTALADRINNEILEYRLLSNIPVTEGITFSNNHACKVQRFTISLQQFIRIYCLRQCTSGHFRFEQKIKGGNYAWILIE